MVPEVVLCRPEAQNSGGHVLGEQHPWPPHGCLTQVPGTPALGTAPAVRSQAASSLLWTGLHLCEACMYRIPRDVGPLSSGWERDSPGRPGSLSPWARPHMASSEPVLSISCSEPSSQDASFCPRGHPGSIAPTWWAGPAETGNPQNGVSVRAGP